MDGVVAQLDPACHDVAAACDGVAEALRLLRHATAVEWASDAADRYLAAVQDALAVVLRAQVLVERADRAVRDHAAMTRREHAAVAGLEAGGAPFCRGPASSSPLAGRSSPW